MAKKKVIAGLSVYLRNDTSIPLENVDSQHLDSIPHITKHAECIITLRHCGATKHDFLLCQTRVKQSRVCRHTSRRRRLTCKLNRVCMFSMDIKQYSYIKTHTYSYIKTLETLPETPFILNSLTDIV